MGFSQQGCWSGLPFPPAGNLHDPGIEPRFPELKVDSLLTEPPGKPPYIYIYILCLVTQSYLTLRTYGL